MPTILLFTGLAALIVISTHKIMSAITDYAAQQKAFNAQLAADVDSLVTSVGGLTGDIQSLNDKITALEAQIGGGLSDEDKAALADVLADSQALVAKADPVAAAAKALDEKTPPVVPENPAVPAPTA